MTSTTCPSKQLVRDFMDARTRSDDPPPTPDEIRRELGGSCFHRIDGQTAAIEIKPDRWANGKPPDCKSGAALEAWRFESTLIHQFQAV